MNSLALHALLGAALGAFTYVGLWWTARRLGSSESPLRLVGVSFILRALPVLAAGVVLVIRGRWWGLLAALLSFVVARVVLSLVYGNVPGLRSGR